MGILDRFRLDGKRAFVTGGSRGLGRSMALALADVGADIVITGRTKDTLEATAGEIRALGRKAWIIEADMAVPDQCETACTEAIAFGPIDILINNVGNREVNVPIEEEPLETWQRMVDLNLTSCFIGTKLVGNRRFKRARNLVGNP